MIFDKFKTKNKYGFSLFEVVVTMAIISIFIAAASNVFTQKFKRKVALPAHGRFECYYDNDGQLTQRLISEDVVVQDFHPTTTELQTNDDGDEVEVVTPLTYCTFEPKKAASYLIINAVAGGGAGGTNYGGSSGVYKSVFLTTTTHTLHVFPGRGATYNAGDGTVSGEFGEQTFMTDVDSGNRDVLRIDGGRSNSGDRLMVKYCSIAYAKYACRREPFCRIDNLGRNLTVGYCSGDGDSISYERDDLISFDTAFYEYRYNSNAELTNMILSYSRLIDTNEYLAPKEAMYTLGIQVEGNFLGTRQESDFMYYLDSLELTDGIATMDPNPGSGGAIRSDGGNGAVIIAW